jgi:hypothetical protein
MWLFSLGFFTLAEPFDISMAGDARLERATSGSGDQRSIHLS